MSRDKSLVEYFETVLHHHGIDNSGRIADELMLAYLEYMDDTKQEANNVLEK